MRLPHNPTYYIYVPLLGSACASSPPMIAFIDVTMLPPIFIPQQ